MKKNYFAIRPYSPDQQEKVLEAIKCEAQYYITDKTIELFIFYTSTEEKTIAQNLSDSLTKLNYEEPKLARIMLTLSDNSIKKEILKAEARSKEDNGGTNKHPVLCIIISSFFDKDIEYRKIAC